MYRLLLALLSLLFSHTALNAQTTWGNIDYDGNPWVQNTSAVYSTDKGLNGRHIALWASHGRYFDANQQKWRWQRPALFCTTEDLFTQTIVIPYLMPMLENAGAVVFSPRERDWQRHEVIVDNDNNTSMVNYREINVRENWKEAPEVGFAMHSGTYIDMENPFTAGTARMIETTSQKNKQSVAFYQPEIPEDGKYAVYVSYQTVDASIDNAKYTVCHKGQKTEFEVNQRMGGSTWVYLGTFDFEAGCSERNHIEVSNYSKHKGVVTTDAIRLGGGMGNIERGGTTSGLPRSLEGARYYAQWAGMPYSIYSSKAGQNDYADDINVRSLMTNLLTGGSCYAPDSVGRHVPIELSLAVHSDAGFTPTGEGVYGTLSICTTQFGDSLLAAGISREASLQLATDLLNNTTADMQYRYGEWTLRKLYDRNYSETRLPIVPSSILETLSHQNFGDMRYGQDPNFRFFLARSIYKTILKYITRQHDKDYAVVPLAPDNFHIEFTKKEGEVRISWQGLIDGQEKTSAPTGYVLYIAQGDNDFDNGTSLKGTSCTMRLLPNVLYNFKVTAVNEGGQSFPTETLSAYYNPKASKRILVVNGFHRLSSPAISTEGQGFDLDADPGITYGRTAGWLGRQQVFDIEQIGVVDSTGLGFSTDELAGTFIAGNDFNYTSAHARAIMYDNRFSIVSCSAQAVENNSIDLSSYDVVDLILGLEKNDGHSLVEYKTFRPSLQKTLRAFTSQGGHLLVSGSFVGSDQRSEEDAAILSDLLKCYCAGIYKTASSSINGLGLEFDFYHQLNERHYAATQTDIMMPTSGLAFPAMVYAADGTSAAVAYQGSDYHAFTMGFPFECITDKQKQARIMKGILSFLINK